MAVYGITVYGEDTYGGAVEESLVGSTMRAESVAHGTGPGQSYGQVRVSWTIPGGSWSRIRLVRNVSGDPLDENDGTAVFEDEGGSQVTEFLDTELTVGRFYYYRLFLEDVYEREWVPSSHAAALVTVDYGYEDQLSRLVPEVFKSTDPAAIGEENEQLTRFLALFGFQLDNMRSSLEHLRESLDGRTVYEKMLPALATQVGLDFEPELGARSMRRLIANAVKLWGQKGTLPGVRGLASAVTGYPAQVRIGQNLALDNADAGPVGGVGNWRVRSGGTVAYRANVQGDEGPAGDGVRVVTASAAAVELDTNRLGLTGIDRMQYAIPVIPNLPYLVSQRVRGGAASAATAASGMQWLDALGVPIGTEVVGDALPVADVWATPVVQAYAPANAAYLEPSLHLAGAEVGEALEHSAFQVLEDVVDAPWRCAREVLVYLAAELVNYVGNTSGDAQNANGWSDGVSAAYSAEHGNHLIRYTPDPVDENTLDVLDVLTVTVAGDAPPPEPDPEESYALTGVYYNDGIRLVGDNEFWTALGEIMDPSTDPDLPPRFARIGFRLYDGPDLIATSLSPSVQLTRGEFTPFTHELFTHEDRPWDRIEYAIYSDGVVAFRKAAMLNTDRAHAFFFDGSTQSDSGDYVWEGQPYASPTHFYRRRATRAARLRALLDDYLPHGACSRIVFGVPLELVPDSPRASSGADVDPDSAPADQVGNSTRLRWSNLTRAGRTLDARFTVFGTPVGAQLSTRWYQLVTQPAVAGQAGDTVAARWAVYAAAAKNMDLRWRTRENVALTDSLVVED